MRIKSESFEARFKRLTDWHPWFAWHPVQIGEQIVVLETVQRKGEYLFGEWIWIYKLEGLE